MYGFCCLVSVCLIFVFEILSYIYISLFFNFSQIYALSLLTFTGTFSSTVYYFLSKCDLFSKNNVRLQFYFKKGAKLRSKSVLWYSLFDFLPPIVCIILIGNGAEALHLLNVNHHLEGGAGGSLKSLCESPSHQTGGTGSRFHLAPPARKHASVRASIKSFASSSRPPFSSSSSTTTSKIPLEGRPPTDIYTTSTTTLSTKTCATGFNEPRKLCATTQTHQPPS